jgi:DNA (cytosine-5)-methyltransferase 1
MSLASRGLRPVAELAADRPQVTLRYLSVCSGIEAASVAWHPLGWEPVAFSEIEPFPSAVLAHHYPTVPNLGDMTKFQEWPDEPVDLLVGGTPCQSFSVAGLRKGLEDPRGNLMLTYLAIAQRYRPRWLVWENVPGVLSSNGGRDFGTFLGALGELGYGWAYRVLDAQWFGVAQRRRRVFVVGHLGDWQRAAKVFFEQESLRRDNPPSREARQGVAAGVAQGFGGGGEDVARCVTTGEAKRQDYETCTMVAHALRAEGFDASEDGTGRGTPLVAQVFKVRGGVEREDGSRGSTNIGKQAGKGYLGSEERAFTLAAAQDQFVAQPVYGTDCYNGAITGDVAATLGTPGSSVNASGPTVMQPAATVTDMRGLGDGHVAPTLRAKETANDFTPMLQTAMQVRRLTPVECERLQGFPDGWTNIPIVKQQPIKGQPAVVKAAADGPRYKALGNSMAVPCMAWIGKRIAEVDRGD